MTRIPKTEDSPAYRRINARRAADDQPKKPLLTALKQQRALERWVTPNVGSVTLKKTHG